MAENKIPQGTPFLRPEQVDTMKLEVGAREQLKNEELEQAICAAQEQDTTMDKETLTEVEGM